ncbi:hypothetical protein D3C72_2219030 [compost metagenome]
MNTFRRRSGAATGRKPVVGNRSPDVLELITSHAVPVVGNLELLLKLNIRPCDVHFSGIGVPAIGNKLHDSRGWVSDDGSRITLKEPFVV